MGISSLVLGAIALAPAAAAANPGLITKAEAREAATVALQRTYGVKWETGTAKEVKPFYRISRSHYQVSWSFSNTRLVPSIYCWGDVIVFSDRYGELWYRVRPDRADGSDC